MYLRRDQAHGVIAPFRKAVLERPGERERNRQSEERHPSEITSRDLSEKTGGITSDNRFLVNARIQDIRDDHDADKCTERHQHHARGGLDLRRQQVVADG